MTTARHAAAIVATSNRLRAMCPWSSRPPPSASRPVVVPVETARPGAMSVEAELVALDVCHHDVTDLQWRLRFKALEPGRAQADQPLGLRLEGRHPLVPLESRRRPYVEVHAVLHPLALRHLLEKQSRTFALGVFHCRGVVAPLGRHAQRLERLVPRLEARRRV